jgi:hypothetical protein
MVVPAPDFDIKNDTLTVFAIRDFHLFYYTNPVFPERLVIFDETSV